MYRLFFAFLFVCVLVADPVFAQMPSLPKGLSSESSSDIRGSDKKPAEQDENSSEDNDNNEETSMILGGYHEFSGFWEGRAGTRLSENNYHRDTSILETRVQLSLDSDFIDFQTKLSTDFILDAIKGDYFDLRETYVTARPFSFMDIKFGRQILTWGTGDLVFLNDMFPKDYISFFTGRDEEYLKAPSDSLKTSLFTDLINVDFVYNPLFSADRYITGKRLSFYDSNKGGIAGVADRSTEDTRVSLFAEDEIALRFFRNINSAEFALYFYDGFWKSPGGQKNINSQSIATFPKLRVYGSSIRLPVLSGIGNAEIAYYYSHQDKEGSDSMINNSQLRFLLGYDREIISNLNLGLQYYLERKLDYDDYKSSLPAGSPVDDENRNMYTMRLTKFSDNQDLELSLFTFWSPTDKDGYIRPKISYQIDDHKSVTAGGNIFFGEERTTDWGKFEDNSNIYMSFRYAF